jgi:hypothetical protein
VAPGICKPLHILLCKTLRGTSLTKQQFVVTHRIRHTEIPALLGSRVKNTPCLNLVSTKIFFSLYLRKNMTCLNVGLLRICQVFFFCRLLRVTTNCCFTRDFQTLAFPVSLFKLFPNLKPKAITQQTAPIK